MEQVIAEALEILDQWGEILEAKFEIRKSKIHGKGLFATKDIKKGKKIGTIELRKNKEKTKYAWWDEPVQGWYFDVHGDFKYMNHSEDPNVELRSRELFATRDIKKGEELTYSYTG